jgi:hypothetical protein
MAAFMADDKTLAPHPDVSWRDIAGEVVAVNVKSGDYFSFNEVGRLVWLGLASGATLDDTATRIAEEYDVTPDQALADVRHFMTALADRLLVSEN